jgi:hypothetical protein
LPGMPGMLGSGGVEPDGNGYQAAFQVAFPDGFHHRLRKLPPNNADLC